jgi:phosphodiester glycosidase
MSSNSLPLRRRLVAGVLPRRLPRLERVRVTLGDGARTTLHVASYERSAYAARVVVLDEPAPLVSWCRESGVRNAVVGGFFVRPQCAPLGQLWIDGKVQPSVAFDPPWGDVRACFHVSEETVRIARYDRLGGEVGGDLLQAGPLLVLDGQRAIVEGEDVEGFSAGAHQFDSDITLGRYPRCALGIDDERLVAIACDGRTRRDVGMTLVELADVLVGLGVTDALNLDGGGSASLVHAGRLRNRPREPHGIDLLEGRSVATAVVFETR